MLSNLTSPIRGRLIVAVYSKWIKPGEKILDVGCGSGIVSQEVGSLLSVRVVGCDVRNYLKRKIEFKEIKNKNSLPFDDKSFDVVMINDTLHHMNFDDQRKTILEALRVGYKLVIFEVEPNLLAYLVDWLINKIHGYSLGLKYYFRKTAEWKKFLSDSGLKVETVQVRRPTFYPFKHIAFCIALK